MMREAGEQLRETSWRQMGVRGGLISTYLQGEDGEREHESTQTRDELSTNLFEIGLQPLYF